MKKISLTIVFLFIINILQPVKLCAMEETKISDFETFPLEIVDTIFNYFEVKELAVCMLVCKIWHDLALRRMLEQLGPGSSYDFLKAYAGTIIKQNRAMRNILSKYSTDNTKQRKLNKKLRKLIKQTNLTFQELKWQIIQCLTQGADLNKRNKKKQTVINMVIKSKQYPLNLVYFLLSLGSRLPKKRYKKKKKNSLQTCFDLSTFDTDDTEELQTLLSQLDSKVIPNFFAHRNKSSLEEIFSNTRDTFFTKLMRPILNNSATAPIFTDETIENIEKNFHFVNVNWLAQLIQIIQNFGIDPITIFINTLQNNPASQLLETVHKELNLTEEQLQHILDSIPHEGDGYDFICEKLKNVSL